MIYLAHISCIQGDLLNEGQECLNQCNQIQGPCNYCGSGLCCRKGWHDTSNGCNGNIGGDGSHTCAGMFHWRKQWLKQNIRILIHSFS